VDIHKNDHSQEHIMSASILNPEERKQLNRVPTDISEEEVVRFFTLTTQDRILIEQKTGAGRRLDQAAQICLVRWLGWSGIPAVHIPPTAMTALCKQLDIPPTVYLIPTPDRALRRYVQQANAMLGWRKYTSALERTTSQ
jgi:hypothetical protein